MKRARLVEARQRKHWTLEDAAARLCVDPNTLWRWEDGRTVPRAHSIAQLCTVYGASAQELGLECEASQDPQRSLVTTTGTATTMTDTIKTSIQQDLTVHLMSIVWSWRSGDRYDDLQAQINTAVEKYNAVIEQDVDQVVTRRNALRTMVLWPIQICGLATLGKASRQPVKDILAQCAAGVTACWYFRKGKELALANDALDVYIPALSSILRSAPEQDRKDAAALLVQCYLLKGTLARYLESQEHSLRYLQQADDYSKVAHNATLSILTARTIAGTQNFAGRQDIALQFAEKAKFLMTKATPHQLQSYVYAGLATYQAHCGKDPHDALSSLNMAYKIFSRDDGVIWIDHSLGNLLQNDAETHYHLGKQQKAIDAFSQVIPLTETDSSLGGRFESYIGQARAEVSREDEPRDMDYCIRQWTQGIEGAKILQSELTFNEARSTYQMMRGAWPGEQRVKDLRELLVHW